MPRLAVLPLAAWLVAGLALAQETPAFDQAHARWTAVLAAVARDGGVDYAKLKKDRAGLDAYLDALHAVTPAELGTWSEAQRLAFWINVYNAHAVAFAADNYPLKSIRKLDGAFGRNGALDKALIPMRAHQPAGKDANLALNDVHTLLRKRFKDARVHAALHNTSKGGPALRRSAYTAADLDAELAEQMRAFLGDPARNRIDPATKELALSQVFKWFAEDFERDAGSVAEFVARFVPAEQAELVRTARVRWLDYDWDLADAAAKPAAK